MQYETNVAVDFLLIINKWLATFFNIFLMLQMLVVYAVEVFLLCCRCYYLMLRWIDGALEKFRVRHPCTSSVIDGIKNVKLNLRTLIVLDPSSRSEKLPLTHRPIYVAADKLSWPQLVIVNINTNPLTLLTVWISRRIMCLTWRFNQIPLFWMKFRFLCFLVIHIHHSDCRSQEETSLQIILMISIEYHNAMHTRCRGLLRLQLHLKLFYKPG